MSVVVKILVTVVVMLSVLLVISQRNAYRWKMKYYRQYQITEKALQLIRDYVPYAWKRRHEEQERSRSTQLRNKTFPYAETNDVQNGMQARIDFLYTSKKGETTDEI